MDHNLYSDDNPDINSLNLEDVNENNNPYKLLEKAIEGMNSDEIIRLFKLCEKDLYIAVIISSFDEILTKGNDNLLYFLGNALLPCELGEDYSRLFFVNEFRKAVKNKDSTRFMEIITRERENVLLPYLAKKLDELLKEDDLSMFSSLATCFVDTEYVSEYERVCERI